MSIHCGCPRTLLSHRDRSKPSNVSRRGEQKSRRWICCSLRSRIVQHRKVLDLAARVRCAESRQTMSIPGPTYLLRPPPPLPCVPRGIRTPGSFALPAPAAAMQGVRYRCLSNRAEHIHQVTSMCSTYGVLRAPSWKLRSD